MPPVLKCMHSSAYLSARRSSYPISSSLPCREHVCPVNPQRRSYLGRYKVMRERGRTVYQARRHHDHHSVSFGLELAMTQKRTIRSLPSVHRILICRIPGFRPPKNGSPSLPETRAQLTPAPAEGGPVQGSPAFSKSIDLWASRLH